MKSRITTLSALATISCMALAASAQEQEATTYIYATYFVCDVTQQDRADEIVKQLDKPIYDAAVDDGTISAWGWMAHHTGGKWRRVQYHRAATMEALLAAQKKIGDQMEAKDKKLDTEAGKICNSHDDYIWRSVAGRNNNTARGAVSFSTYYVCDQNREEEADALVKKVYAPIYDKLVSDGKLKSWAWNEHIVGGEYRRLAVMTADDMTSLMQVRAGLIETITKEPLTRTFDSICGSHTDYMWEIRNEKP
jgi:hypothetical protein